MITRIHVNQHVLRRNRKEGRRDPILTVKTSRENVPDYRRRPFHFLLMISGIVRHLLPAAL